MNKRNIVIIIVGVIVLLVVVLSLYLFISNKKEESKTEELYVTKDDVSYSDVDICYTDYNMEVNCDNIYEENITIKTEKRLSDKNPVQKVLVDLNGEDKAVFIVLKGDINKNEDLLLIYDGLYVESSSEAYYTYDRGKDVLESLNWNNASVVRLLTVDEAKLLKCDKDTACGWLVDKPDNDTGINNSFGYYGFGFTLEKEVGKDYFYFINQQGYLVTGEIDDTYGLRPVIQINSKYVNLYSTTNKVILKKDNQTIETIFIDDKLAEIIIKNVYKKLSKNEFNAMKNKLEARIETNNINYKISDFEVDYRDYREITDYTFIDCKDISLAEINKFLSISSLELNSKQYINEMKRNGYNE